MTWLTIVILALATFRLTRVVVVDEIGEPVRAYLLSRQKVESRTDINAIVLETRVVRRDRRYLSWWAYRVTACPWCASVWIGGAVVALQHYQGEWFVYVAIAFALSAVAGLLSERT